MAIYECFDSFSAFEHYLGDSGPDLEPAARLLLSEYCRYALHRAIYYYPEELPPEAIAEKKRENNGHIDRKLSFPLEDLYPDGQQAGQVGQERSEEHTSELQSLMRISYAVFCWTEKKN